MTIRTILVTGGSGFLGRRIVAAGQACGYDVLAPRSSELNLEQPITDQGALQRFTSAGIDAIIHSAAYYGGLGINQSDPAGLISRNTQMCVTVFQLAQILGVKKIISVGSSCSYPGHLHEGLREGQIFDGRCHDSVEGYGFSKRIHLVFQRAYYKQFGIASNQLCLTNLYGEGDVFTEYRAHAISALIKKIADAKLSGGTALAWGTGSPRREFLHVDDAASVIVRALDLPHDDEPINVWGEEISIRDLALLIADMVGLPQNRIAWDATKPDGIPRKFLDGAKLRRLMPDYAPLSLRQGLAKTVAWYMQNKAEADRRS